MANNDDLGEFIVVYEPRWQDTNLERNEVLIPYSQITSLHLGKKYDYAAGETSDIDELIIRYGVPAGSDGVNWSVHLFGDYAHKVYAHLTGVNGLGRIYRITEDKIDGE